jgi:hypothetical protein
MWVGVDHFNEIHTYPILPLLPACCDRTAAVSSMYVYSFQRIFVLERNFHALTI